jgi:hypothetical protein
MPGGFFITADTQNHDRQFGAAIDMVHHIEWALKIYKAMCGYFKEDVVSVRRYDGGYEFMLYRQVGEMVVTVNRSVTTSQLTHAIYPASIGVAIINDWVQELEEATRTLHGTRKDAAHD